MPDDTFKEFVLDQLRARYGDKVEISYVQREPGAIVIDFVKKQA